VHRLGEQGAAVVVLGVMLKILLIRYPETLTTKIK
jgi:hypothetical protein